MKTFETTLSNFEFYRLTNVDAKSSIIGGISKAQTIQTNSGSVSLSHRDCHFLLKYNSVYRNGLRISLFENEINENGRDMDASFSMIKDKKGKVYCVQITDVAHF